MAIAVAELEELIEQVVAVLRPQPRPTLLELWTWWSSTSQARALAFWPAIESRWHNWLEPVLGELRAGEVTVEHIEKALERAELAGKSAQTVNHIVVDCRRLIRAAIASQRWKGHDPTPYLRRRALRPAERATLTVPEASRLLEGVSGKYRGIYALALYLGLRKGEILGLRRSDVDLEQLELRVRFSHGRPVTKNGQWRTLPICSELATILRAWLDELVDVAGDVLFPGRSAGGRMGIDAAISKRLRFALDSVGIVKPTIRFHDLRHTFASLADEAGIAEGVVAKVLGHSPSITERYTHRRVALVRQDLERLKFQQVT